MYKRQTCNRAIATKIQNSGVPYVYVDVEGRRVKVLSNLMVDASEYLNLTEEELEAAESMSLFIIQY